MRTYVDEGIKCDLERQGEALVVSCRVENRGVNPGSRVAVMRRTVIPDGRACVEVLLLRNTEMPLLILSRMSLAAWHTTWSVTVSHSTRGVAKANLGSREVRMKSKIGRFSR
jgi:hypothetical protein